MKITTFLKRSPNMSFTKRYLLVLFLLLLSFLSGCSSFGLSSLKNAMAGEEGRAKTLSKSVDTYHKAVYWGDTQAASSFVDPEVKSSFVRDIASRKKSEKLVEITVESLEIGKEALDATVTTKTRYFKIPSYKVQERFETETWKYEKYDGGWINTGVEEFVAGSEESSESKPFRARLGSFKELELE